MMVMVVVVSCLCLFVCLCVCVFFVQAEDGIRDRVRSRGLGDVYKRQPIIPWPRTRLRQRWAARRAVVK